MPSDHTGFFASEMLYGRIVRGPLSVLRDLWEDTELDDDQQSCIQYVIDLKDKLAECAKIAIENADVHQSTIPISTCILKTGTLRLEMRFWFYFLIPPVSY